MPNDRSTLRISDGSDPSIEVVPWQSRFDERWIERKRAEQSVVMPANTFASSPRLKESIRITGDDETTQYVMPQAEVVSVLTLCHAQHVERGRVLAHAYMSANVGGHVGRVDQMLNLAFSKTGNLPVQFFGCVMPFECLERALSMQDFLRAQNKLGDIVASVHMKVYFASDVHEILEALDLIEI